METRIKTKLWVDAHVRTCFSADMPAFVLHKGDEDRGGVVLKVNRFSAGVVLLEQTLDFDGNRVWRYLGPAEGEEERLADERLSKKRQFDADFWVLEIEDHRSAYVPDAPIASF